MVEQRSYPFLVTPEKCPEKSSKKLILFGIKSMPSHWALRDTIRRTWLNRAYWPDADIHYVFLLGTEQGQPLTDDDYKHNDILQGDFKESHYSLVYKDDRYLSN